MIEKATVATTYTASAVTTMAGLTINEWVALGGFLMGVATFVVNLWFKREHLNIERQRNQADGKDD
ncbi:phage holin [Candidatus Williamhamiltonella defendens]|uniref:Holin n=1 Tax=Candidatus Hamiltonella defensa (Bemisia tabaci) TaxID=672795 RepID=A0A249DZD5_9ENTR|nr:phage holin [Candidatus Hamiltonella defensa]ASX25881.1 hypothetical protein BA171_01685 [Candidatus Hamiltonella defensa (Bemisia tabaci)]ASX26142.1 hypothetical protein BA171_03285 [Candidatus Hamiltonella defensa (Bemisia tabaci)]CED78667.1 Lysis S family protein [Candidatus Hamiltonella defensa (Bemisia tabaci)]